MENGRYRIKAVLYYRGGVKWGLGCHFLIFYWGAKQKEWSSGGDSKMKREIKPQPVLLKALELSRSGNWTEHFQQLGERPTPREGGSNVTKYLRL